jgi:hypothetical protein
MRRSPGVVAHVIVGSRPETYLAAALAAVESACSHAVINDNSGMQVSPNAASIAGSAFAKSGRLTLLRTTFEDFASARNACIDATPPEHRDGWVLFVDADEIHGGELPGIVALLPRLPTDIDAVDGYSRHFMGSFSWWRTIERRLCFFRYAAHRRWSGAVHERLSPLARRAVIPAVWFHYGHVVPPRREWEKSRQYAELAHEGWSPNDADLLLAIPDNVWGHLLKQALPYHGQHPPAMRTLIASLQREWASTFADVDRLARQGSLLDRMSALARAANWSRLLAWRGLEARVRWGWRPSPPSGAVDLLEARSDLADMPRDLHAPDDAAHTGGRR